MRLFPSSGVYLPFEAKFWPQTVHWAVGLQSTMSATKPGCKRPRGHFLGEVDGKGELGSVLEPSSIFDG